MKRSEFFFVRRKTAYEMLRRLVGSEMCIRVRYIGQAVDVGSRIRQHLNSVKLMKGIKAVSYTHLTLPTIHSV